MTPKQIQLVRDSFERAAQQDDHLGERFIELLASDYPPFATSPLFTESTRLAPLLLRQVRMVLLQLGELTILVGKVQRMVACHQQRELTPEFVQAAHDAWLRALQGSLGQRYYTRDVANAWETAIAIVFGAIQISAHSPATKRPAPSGWRRLLRPMRLSHA